MGASHVPDGLPGMPEHLLAPEVVGCWAEVGLQGRRETIEAGTLGGGWGVIVDMGGWQGSNACQLIP